jgi:diguanylate cyclase
MNMRLWSALRASAEPRANAPIERTALPAYLDRLIAAHAAADRGVGLLVVRLALADAAAFEFAPHMEDRMCAEAMRHLRAVLRPNDRIAQLGPTELAIVLPMVSGPEQAELAALKALRALDQAMQWSGRARRLRAAIGVAAAPSHAATSAQLVRYARLAAYAAESKESSYHVFEPTDLGDEAQTPELEASLRTALADNALDLYYQPQIELASGRAVGAEALARWFDAEGHAISPAVFVPLAERRGLMGSFTSWSLNAGLRQLAAFRAAGFDMQLGINVSPLNLAEPDFPELVAQALGMWSVPATRITLEITESTPMHDADNVVPMLVRLKDVGVRLAIDDFGTGYSSLALLRRLPVDELKIDQQFVRGMLASEESLQIVRTVLDLAQNFRLRTVAEGVEDEATLAALRDMGCTQAQGFVLSRAVPAAELRPWFAARH